jgi:hypothetical protein
MHPGTGVTIISYPKTGRTWLRVLIGKAICDHAGLHETMLLNTPRLTAEAGLSVTRFTHDDASLNAAQHYRTLETRKTRFRNQKVIFLARDPRDTMVSCYFQATRRVDQFDGTISEFIRDDRLGIRKYVQFANVWYENRSIPQGYLTLHYEAMKADTHAAVRQVLDFLGAQAIPDAIIEQAVEYSSFENMKKLEKARQFQEARMQPGDASDPESFKVRKGSVGGFGEYLSEADTTYIEAIVQEMNYPFPLASVVSDAGVD